MSSSTTATDPGAQPSSIARSFSAYWRAADSTLRSTCPSVDWRTYTTARRRRCATVILPRSLIAFGLDQAGQQPRQAHRHLALDLRRQRLPYCRRDHLLLADRQRQLDATAAHEAHASCRRPASHADRDRRGPRLAVFAQTPTHRSR